MKLKLLSIFVAVGLLLSGATSVMAVEEKLALSPVESTKEVKMIAMGVPNAQVMIADASTFCDDPSSLQCKAYTKIHEFIVGKLCTDPAVAPATTKSANCKKLCGGVGATLNDLSCCITEVGDSLGLLTKGAMAAACTAVNNTPLDNGCSYGPLANYVGWFCCPRNPEHTSSCFAKQTPAPTCAGSFKPASCTPITR